MKPTEQQRLDAMLHATAWRSAADSLSKNALRDPSHIKQYMGVTVEQLHTAKWLAHAVADGYRQIVNGADVDE